MRILVGTVEIAGMIPIFADGFRSLGHRVTTAVRARHPFSADLSYDVEIERGGRLVRCSRLLNLIAKHDVFVFLWAGDSLRWLTDLPLLKFLGKRIVYLFMGDDVRHALAYQQEASTFYAQGESAFILSPDHSERLEHDPLARALRNVRTAELYSDLILSLPSNSGLLIRPYNHLFVPLDLSKYRAEIPRRDVPVVLHAPSDKGVKGTDFILPVLDKLKSEGVAFELRYVHKMPHQRVVTELMGSDVVVDQLFFPLHGKLGVEAMATGCALATSNREDYETFPPNRPIWHVDPGNLYIQLKRLLMDKELRVRLALQGRAYVEKYHDHVNVARHMLESLSAEEPRQHDYYPTFYTQRFNLPEGVVVPGDLRRMTAQIVQRYGLPDGIDPEHIIRRGLMSANGLKASSLIPRWKCSSRSRG